MTKRPSRRPPDLPPGVYHREAQSKPNEIEEENRPDLSDVRILTATSFLQFCRTPGIKAMRLSWDELESYELGPDTQNRTTAKLPTYQKGNLKTS
jgi:hypothetical protein